MLLNGLKNTFQDYNPRFGGNLTRLLAEQRISMTVKTGTCTQVTLTYVDKRAAPSMYSYCPNGTYTTWPSQWTNFTYLDPTTGASFTRFIQGNKIISFTTQIQTGVNTI